MIISVKVKTNTKIASIKRIDDDHYEVCVNTIPEKGKANDAVIDVISKYFNVSKSNILITRGAKSKLKLIEVIIPKKAL